MKKRIAWILSVILTLSLCTASMTSCLGEDSALDGQTPLEAYTAALEAINTSKNYEMVSEQEISMKMNVAGQTVDQEQTQTIEQKMNGDNIYVKVGGSALEMETWYVDGMLYTSTSGVKAKAKISLEEYQEQYMGESESTILDIPDDWFDGVKFETKDGKKCLEFAISGEQYSSLVGNVFDSMGLGEMDGSISDVTYCVYFDADGNISKILCDFSMEFTMQGIEVEATYHTVSTLKVGSVEEITAPADADSYTDVTDQM